MKMSNQGSNDNNDDSLLRYCADLAGYQEYTYGDIVGSWRHQVSETVDSIGSYLSNINCMSVVDQMGDMSYELEQSLDNMFNQSSMTDEQSPSEILREIAETVNTNTQESRNRTIARSLPRSGTHTNNVTDVKVKLDRDGRLLEIKIKKLSSNRYVKVPFDNERNPFYIQNILDTYFVEDGDYFYSGGCLFEDLAEHYKNSRVNHSVSWFEDRVEWVKFTYSQRYGMRPCGYKVYKRYSKNNQN